MKIIESIIECLITSRCFMFCIFYGRDKLVKHDDVILDAAQLLIDLDFCHNTEENRSYTDLLYCMFENLSIAIKNCNIKEINQINLEIEKIIFSSKFLRLIRKNCIEQKIMFIDYELDDFEKVSAIYVNGKQVSCDDFLKLF